MSDVDTGAGISMLSRLRTLHSGHLATFFGPVSHQVYPFRSISHQFLFVQPRILFANFGNFHLSLTLSLGNSFVDIPDNDYVLSVSHCWVSFCLASILTLAEGLDLERLFLVSMTSLVVQYRLSLLALLNALLPVDDLQVPLS